MLNKSISNAAFHIEGTGDRHMYLTVKFILSQAVSLCIVYYLVITWKRDLVLKTNKASCILCVMIQAEHEYKAESRLVVVTEITVYIAMCTYAECN